MTTRHSFAYAALLATGLMVGAAQAQAPDPGANGLRPGGNVVGGGVATLTGNGDDMLVTYARGGAGGGAGGTFDQAGGLASFAGSDGDGPRWTYAPPSLPGDRGREAWLSGSGDDAAVRYADPARQATGR